jgi:hypothetical protein
MRSKVPIGTRMKMTAFWHVALCILEDTNRRFRGSYCLHHEGNDGDSKFI